LGEAQIIVSTAAKWSTLRDGSWPWAIIDEAYQMRSDALLRIAGRFERTLFVGDRLRQDVRGAHDAGMVTVQALWSRADEHPDGAEPDFEAYTMMDVLNIVSRLNGTR